MTRFTNSPEELFFNLFQPIYRQYCSSLYEKEEKMEFKVIVSTYIIHHHVIIQFPLNTTLLKLKTLILLISQVVILLIFSD